MKTKVFGTPEKRWVMKAEELYRKALKAAPEIESNAATGYNEKYQLLQTDERKKKDSRNHKYWHPDLKQGEWDLLNREMHRQLSASNNILDKNTKWLYSSEKGMRVFAIYGVGDGTDPTPLYAVGGANAERKFKKLTRGMEAYNSGSDGSGADGSRETFDQIFETLSNREGRSDGGITPNERRRSGNGNVGISFEAREIDKPADFGSSKDDRGEIGEKGGEALDSKTDLQEKYSMSIELSREYRAFRGILRFFLKAAHFGCFWRRGMVRYSKQEK
ncbi:hypothetical protein [Acidaminobacterium chupaoyuni]